MGVVVGLVAATAVVVATVGFFVLRDDDPRPAVSVRGWSARSVTCGYRENPDELSVLGAGDVVALDATASELLTAANCRTTRHGSREAAPIRLREDRSYFLLDTGLDRLDVRLVDVDLDDDRAHLVAEVTVPGTECGVTAEYRGQLMLLIEAPHGAPLPAVSLDQVRIGC